MLVVVANPDDYREAIDAWRRSATVTQELKPWLALASTTGAAAPVVPGTHWFTGEVPMDVLLRLPPPARIFVAAWRERQAPKKRPGDGLPGDTPADDPPHRTGDDAD